MFKSFAKLLVLNYFLHSVESKWSVVFVNISHPLKKFGNLDLTHWKGSDGAPYFNSTATIFEDLGRQKELVQIYQQASPSDTTCSHLYFQSTLDLCKAMTGIVKSPFARVFVDGFLRGADHVPGCTTPKGVYTSTNFTFNEMLFFPIKNNVRFRLVFKFMAFKPNNKTLIYLYTATLVGEFQQNLLKVPFQPPLMRPKV